MIYLPQSRTSELVVQEYANEILIYDLKIHKAISLNKTSAIVYLACNGTASFAELRTKYKFTDDLIYLTLDKLAANDLLIDYTSDHFAGLSRREVIRRVGVATMIALPVIAGLIAPQAADAASGTTCGQSCSGFEASTGCTGICPNCRGNGTCGGSAPCTNIGGSCTITGTCVFDGGTYVCSVGGRACSGPGSCTSPTYGCLGDGTCQA